MEPYRIEPYRDPRASLAVGEDPYGSDQKHVGTPGYVEVTSPMFAAAPKKGLWARTMSKIGWAQLSILVLGNAGILGGLGFLRFLWPWALREEHATWGKIVFSGWLLRVITITSILIRASMGLQATVFCMVMASITLQRRNVRIDDVAKVSIFRFTNSGPVNMIEPLRHAFQGWKSSLAIIITTLLTITTLMSQFTSTILLTDIGTEELTTYATEVNILFGGNNSQADEFYVGTTSRSWEERPHFETFAEEASENIKLGANGGGLFATGNSLRAFMPVSRDERVQLAEYQGPATVMDSRVICISPYISELAVRQFDSTSRIPPSDTVPDYSVTGMMSTDALTPHLDRLVALGFFTQATSNQFRNLTDGIQFGCRIPSVMPDRGDPEWKISLCRIDMMNATNPSMYPTELGQYPADGDRGFDPDSRDWIEPVENTDFYDGILPWGFLVLNLTGEEGLWALPEGGINESGVAYGNSTSDGEWSKISYPVFQEEGPPIPLDMSLSLCFTSFRARNAIIDAEAKWDFNEPVLTKNTDSPRYNTSLIRKFLGVSNGSNADLEAIGRGILDLGDINRDSMSNLSDTMNYIQTSLISKDLQIDSPSALFQYPTARMCIWCYPDVLVHEGLIAVFQDTLSTTYHPALALQALLTTKAMQIYGDRSPDFTIHGNATMRIFEPFQVPIQSSGYYVVCGMVAFHLISMMYMTIVFFQIEGQAIGQAWQTVGQLQSRELQEVMEVSRASADPEVIRWLKSKGELKKRVGVRGGHVVQTRGSTITTDTAYMGASQPALMRSTTDVS